jgi:hypothetical protein
MANRKETRTGRSVQKGEYGPIAVQEGKHKGKVGYYDDDEGTLAIIYFGTPFESDYVLIRRSWLKKTAVTPLALEKWKRKYPELAKRFAVP